MEVVENLSAQVVELEALQSVYPKELVVADHGVLADINSFVHYQNGELPGRLEYAVEIPIENGVIELIVSLPTNYPKEKPEIYARGCKFSRKEQQLLNEALGRVVDQQEAGEPCIYSLISWLQDHVEEFVHYKTCEEKIQNKEEADFTRYWIYSHHIYSKVKRRLISDLAKENSVTGFCLAGKPGVICLEGMLQDCDYFWQQLKNMNWQKILIRFMEKEERCQDVDSARKFSDFQEISFPTTDRHNDMGKFLKYLTEHQARYAFKELFGIQGKLQNSSINCE